MKQKLVSFISRFNYPQYSFASAIKKILLAKKKKKWLIIDAPCGNGETSYNLSNLYKSEVFAFDISPQAIQIAKTNFTKENLHFESCDIFSVLEKQPNADCFCVINSLFLLPQQDLILRKIVGIIADSGILIVILPNIDGPNYLRFKKNNSKVNSLELSEKEFDPFFTQRNLKIEKLMGIAFVPLWGRKDVKLFSIFAPFYLLVLNQIYSLIPFKKPNYYLLALRKLNA